MDVGGFAEKLNAVVLTGDPDVEREISGIYACDLLSRVMAWAGKGNAWITVHTHVNIVAVALLAELSCIILPEGIEIEEQTLKKAREEGIPILSTTLDCYGICCAFNSMASPLGEAVGEAD